MAETTRNQFLLEKFCSHLSKSKQQNDLPTDPIETAQAMLHFCASPDQIPNREINRLASHIDLMTTPGINQIDIRVTTKSKIGIPDHPHLAIERRLPRQLITDPLPPFLSLIGESSALWDRLSSNYSLQNIIKRSQAYQSELLQEIDCLSRRLNTQLEGELPYFGRYQSGLASLGLNTRGRTKYLLIN